MSKGTEDKEQEQRDGAAYTEARAYLSSPLKAIQVISHAKMHGHACVHDAVRGMTLECEYTDGRYTFLGVADTIDW